MSQAEDIHSKQSKSVMLLHKDRPQSAAACCLVIRHAKPNHALTIRRFTFILHIALFAEMLPVGHKRKRVQTKLFGDDFVREDLRPGKGARRRKVMEPRGPDEAQGADALLSLAALAEAADSDTQSADEGDYTAGCTSFG